MTTPDTLLTNARLILDGSVGRTPPSNVLVKNGSIRAVSPRRLDPGEATVIDVAGRTLMPGLIDVRTATSRDCR